MNKIFLLERNDWCPLDENYRMVIIARDEIQARTIAAKNVLDEVALEWLDPHYSTCEEIDLSEPRLVLAQANCI